MPHTTDPQQRAGVGEIQAPLATLSAVQADHDRTEPMPAHQGER